MKKIILALVFLCLSLPAFAGVITSPSLCNRAYHIYVPADVPINAPLVIALHPGTSNGSNWETALGLDTYAESQKFIVAYPEGSEPIPYALTKTWNSGWNPFYAETINRRDIDFIHDLIRHIEEHQSIDTTKIYIAGYSNGAMLGYRYICTYPTDIAGMVVAAGALSIDHDACAATVNVPVKHIYGDSDVNVPPAGGIGINGEYYTSLASTEFFLASHGATFTNYRLTGVDHDYTNITAGLTAQFSTSQAALVAAMVGTTSATGNEMYIDTAHTELFFTNTDHSNNRNYK